MATEYVDGVSEHAIEPWIYSQQLDCIHELLPYQHLRMDPWDELASIRDYCVTNRERMATFCYREVDGLDPRGINGDRMHLYCHLLGAWAMQKGSQRNYRWVNPRYVHYDDLEWTPINDRLAHWETLADLGIFSKADAANRYNQTREAVYYAFRRDGMSWSDRRTRGRERLANSIKVATTWTDLSKAQVARVLDCARSTVSEMVSREATVDVPPRPCETQRARNWG